MLARFLTLGILIGILGCGSSDPLNRQPVSGMISYKGKPIVFGTIEFTPNEGQSTPLTTQITDGKFSIDKSGGLSPGAYTVRIEGFDAPPPVQDIPGNPKGPTAKQLVPAKYNTQSKETFTVKSGTKNELVLDLQ